MFSWIVVVGIAGWLGWLAEHLARKRNLRVHTEVEAFTLPDGSHLASVGEGWTVLFPAGSARARTYVSLNAEQAARLTKLWEAAVAEAADRIYVGDLTPTPVK